MLVLFVSLSITLGVFGAQRPNLLFMMADQLRWDAVGVVNPRAKTPNLNNLARSGVQFSRAYTSTPTCTPARSAILTGQNPWNHGMLGYGVIPHEFPFEMPRALASVGYYTVSFGKDHFGWDRANATGYPHGYSVTDLYDGIVSEPDQYHKWFERLMPGKTPESGWPTLDMNSWRGAPYVYNESLHPTAWVGRAAVKFLESYDNTTTPFFAKVSFHRPHSPYDPPARILDTISESDLPPIRIASDGWDNVFTGLASAPKGCGPVDKDAWCGKMPSDATLLARRAYYGSIAFVDEQVGAIMSTLESRGLLDNTWVLWTADHGDGQSDHWHWRKGYPYELSSHIPMFLRWPNTVRYPVPRGSILDNVAELRDVLPTMLSAAGAMATIPQGHVIDGKPLQCLLEDPAGARCAGGWRQWLDLEHSTCYNETNHWNALTDGSIKYIFNAYFPSEQLFNLTADPFELVDVSTSSAYAPTLALWRQRLVDFFEKQQRGPKWVKDGKLQRREKGQTYSPNFPHGGHE